MVDIAHEQAVAGFVGEVGAPRVAGHDLDLMQSAGRDLCAQRLEAVVTELGRVDPPLCPDEPRRFETQLAVAGADLTDGLRLAHTKRLEDRRRRDRRTLPGGSGWGEGWDG